MLKILSFIRFMGLGIAIPAVLGSSILLAQSPESRVATPNQHRPVTIRHLRENGTADSTNWSGYAVTGATGSVTSVTGSWVVPASTCSRDSKPEYAAFWVGIDGWSSDTVEQVGTDSDCTNGRPSYYAWYEFYPQPSYYAGRLTNLTPGHVMSASVTYDATSNEFTATITDVTEPTLTFTTTFKPSRQTGTPSRSSAEWIAEAPSSSSGVLPLADFGAVNFGLDYTSVLGTNYATVSGVAGPIQSFGANVWSSAMVNEKTDAPMAVPSALTSDGSSFVVSWLSVGP